MPSILVELGGEGNPDDILHAISDIRASHPGVMHVCAFSPAIPPGIDLLHSTILYRNPDISLYHQLTSTADVIFRFP